MPGPAERWISRTRDFASGGDSRAHTLAEIARLARGAAVTPLFRSAAVKLARGCSPRDTRCYASTILDGLRERCRWIPDPESLDRGHELVADPAYTIGIGGGDCDDLTSAYISLALAIGLRVAVVSGIRPNNKRHVLPAVWIDGAGWLAADPSSPAPLGADPRLTVETFQEIT